MINTEPIGYDFLPSTTVLAAMKLGPFAIGRVTMAGWVLLLLPPGSDDEMIYSYQTLIFFYNHYMHFLCSS